MLHFIHENLDRKKPTAVLAAFIDFSKAFNRMDHNIIVTILSNRMKINNKKTKIMIFNFSKNFDFLPQLHFPAEEPLEDIIKHVS